jgi:hypothetical protein
VSGLGLSFENAERLVISGECLKTRFAAIKQMPAANSAVENGAPFRLICVGLALLTMPVMVGLVSPIVTPPAPSPKAGLAFL